MVGLLKVVVPILGLVVIGAGVVALIMGDPRPAASWDEEESMATGAQTTIPQVTSTAMDASGSIRIETATFALG